MILFDGYEWIKHGGIYVRFVRENGFLDYVPGYALTDANMLVYLGIGKAKEAKE